MSTLAHPRLTTPGTTAAPHSDRVPLYQAIEAAEPQASPWRERLRHPFVRRPHTVGSLIRKHRLLPAMEFAYDVAVEHFGQVRVEITAESDPDGFAYLRMNVRAPSIDIERLLDLEDALRTEVWERSGEKVSQRLSIPVNPDPDHLPASA